MCLDVDLKWPSSESDERENAALNNLTNDGRITKALKTLSSISFPPLAQPFPLEFLYINGFHASSLQMQNHQLSHSHTHFELLFSLNGALHYRINDEQITVKKGQFLLISPGTQHAQSAPDAESIKLGMGLLFLQDSQKNFPDQLKETFSKQTHVVGDQTDEMQDWLKSVLRECTAPTFFSPYLIRDIAVRLLIEIWLCIKGDSKEEYRSPHLFDDQRIVMAKQFIYDNLSVPLNSGMVADHIHLSLKQLNRIFFLTDGMTVSKYIFNAKTNEAIKLLRISKLSVGEVAEALGFSTVKAFSMFFKRNTGFTPSEFRKCTK